MKIGKRILAGTLALMSGLSCISAQEHESQDVPQKTVQKESVHDSVKKWSYSNVLKGTALGCVIGGITGGIYWYVVNRKDEIDETRVRLRRASNKVLYYYACPAMRNHIEKLSKDEIYLENVKCLEAFTYLFKFLDGDEDRDDRRIRESLECIVSGTHQELDIELSKFDMNSTNSRGAESDALTVDLLNNLTRLNKFIYGEPKDLLSVCVIRGYADFPCRLENFKVLKHKSVPGLIYNLCGIIVVDKNSDCPYASSYMKCGNKWYRLSFVEGRVEVSEKVVYDVCQKFNESSTLLYSCQSEDRV